MSYPLCLITVVGIIFKSLPSGWMEPYIVDRPLDIRIDEPASVETVNRRSIACDSPQAFCGHVWHSSACRISKIYGRLRERRRIRLIGERFVPDTIVYKVFRHISCIFRLNKRVFLILNTYSKFTFRPSYVLLLKM